MYSFDAGHWAFQKHANSEAQQPPPQLRFSLPLIVICGLRTTAGRALSFVCSTGLSRANIERQDCTTDSSLREKTTRKDLLVFITVHKNASQFCL